MIDQRHADMRRITQVKREAEEEHEERLIPVALHSSYVTLYVLQRLGGQAV